MALSNMVSARVDVELFPTAKVRSGLVRFLFLVLLRLSGLLQRPRQLCLVRRLPTVLRSGFRVFLTPFIDGAPVEQVYDHLGIEDVKRDPSGAPVQPYGPGSCARQAPVREPAVPFAGFDSQDVLNFSWDDG